MAGYQAVTLAQLQAQLSERLEGKPWWTSTESRSAINEGLRIWNAATGQWTSKFYVRPIPFDPYVPLPGTVTQATRVSWNQIPLEKGSLAEFDYGIPQWRGATTASGGIHPTRPVYWAPVALTLLVIYPADATQGVTGTGADDVTASPPSMLEVSAVRQTPLLTDPGDFVDLGEEDHDRLLAYAQHVLALKVGGQTLVESYPGWLDFLKAAGAQNQQFAATQFYRRALGIDQQRRLRRQSAPVRTPVEGALQAAIDNLKG